METSIIRLMEIAFSGFWLFVGALLIYGITVQACVVLLGRALRSLNVWFRGWPPEHLDADGDFKRE